MAPLRSTLLATLAAVALLCALLFPGALFHGEVLSQADFLLEHEPWRAVAPPGFVAGNSELSDQATQFQPWDLLRRERFAGGALPLWNPRAAGGEPLLANLQSAVLSPFSALAQLFPFGLGLLVAAVAQLLCAGLGTALFARRLGCSLPACVFAALAFTFGGFQFLWLQHPHAAVSCLLPWLLLLADLWVEAATSAATGAATATQRPGWLSWLRPALALSVAALILCGHVETALHVALAVAAWAVLASAGSPLVARLRLLADMGLWSLVGAALAGLQVLPFVEYLHLSEIYAKRNGFQELWRRVPWEHTPMMIGAALLTIGAVLASRRALRGVTSPSSSLSSSLSSSRGGLVVCAWFALAVALGALLLHALDAAGFSPFHRLLFHPDAYGHPVPSRGAPFGGPRSYVNINNGYAGVLTLLLALFAVVCGPRDRRDLAGQAARADHAEWRGRPGPHGARSLAWLWLLTFLLAYELPVLSQLVNRLPLLNLALNYRFTLVVGFCGAMLAGIGLDALCRPATRGRPAPSFWLLAGVLVGALGLAPDMVGAHSPEPRWWALGAGAVLILLWGTLSGRHAWLPFAALALLGADMFLFARGVHPSAPAGHVFPPTPVTEFLASQPEGGRLWAVRRDTLMPNTAGVYGLSDLRGYDALGVERMAWLREALRPAAPRASHTAPNDTADAPQPARDDLDVGSALFDVLDVRWVLAPVDWTPPEGSRFTRAFASGECVVWRNERAHGRAFVAATASSIDAYLDAASAPSAAANAAFADLPAEAAARQRTLNIALAIGAAYHAPAVAGRPLLIEGDAPLAEIAPGGGAVPHGTTQQSTAASGDAPGGGAQAATSPAGTVAWRVDEPEHQELDVTAAAPGWLCVADAFYPGWTASVNGAPAEIVPAFLALRAVRVPAGSSRVVFRYEPQSALIGLRLSAGAAGLVLVAALVALRSRSRAGKSHAGDRRGVAESTPGPGAPRAASGPGVPPESRAGSAQGGT